MKPWTQFRDFPKHSAVLSMRNTFFVAIFLLASLISVIGVHSSKHYEVAHANAQFISQEHIINFWVTERVRIKFVSMRPVRTIITYVYPQSQGNLREHARIPIIYELGHPSSAYFAGPGGDVYAPNYPGTGPLIAFVVAIISGAWLYHESRWRRRIISLIDSASDQGPIIRARWYNHRYSSTIVTASPVIPWQLSWKVLVIDSRVDIGSLRKFKKAWPKRNRIMFPRAQADAKLKIARQAVLRSGDYLFLPLSRPAPITLTDRVSSFVNEGEDLESCHNQLLSAYADVLNRIRQLPAVFAGRGRRYSIRRGSRFRTLFCWRFMVRLHAEAHIRRQLRNMANSYVRRQFSSISASGVKTEKLSSLQEECNKIIESLSDNSRLIPVLVVVLTIVAPVAPLILKGNPVPLYELLTTALVFIAAAIVFLPGTAAVIAYADAFRFKRQLFGADLPSIKSDNAKSIYELEDRLYRVLDQPKRSENASDLWVRASVITILWIAIVRLFSRPPYLQLPILYWVIAVIIIFPTWSLAKGIWFRWKAER